MRKWVFGLLLAGVILVSGNRISAEDGPSNEAALRFEVISDIHVQKWDWRAVDKLKRALSDIQDAMPGSQALVVNGDLGNGLPEDYEALRKIMDGAKLPQSVFYNMGNHEYYKSWYDKNGYWNPVSFPNGETEQASQQRYLAFTGLDRLYYDRWVGGYHFIMLASEKYRQSDSSYNEDAWLSNDQLDWLQNKLSEKEEAGKPIFVFLHQPLPNTVAGSSTGFNNRAVIQYKELKSILASHPQVILFSGHTHWELKSPKTLVQDGLFMVGSSSVYEPFNQNDIAYDMEDDRSEGLSVEVYPSKVMIRGRDFTNAAWIPEAQFQISLPK